MEGRYRAKLDEPGFILRLFAWLARIIKFHPLAQRISRGRASRAVSRAIYVEGCRGIPNRSASQKKLVRDRMTLGRDDNQRGGPIKFSGAALMIDVIRSIIAVHTAVRAIVR